MNPLPQEILQILLHNKVQQKNDTSHTYNFLFSFLIIFYWLFYFSCSNFNPIAPLHPALLRESPQLCSCPWIVHIRSLATPFPIPYFTSPWLFYNLLFVLNPLTSSPIPPHAPPIWQPSRCSPYS